MAEGQEKTAALFVRLPREQAERLDRAAFEARTPKRELVTRLVARFVDPGSTDGLVGGEEGLAVGRHAFRPSDVPEVLTLAQAAELLQVEEAALRDLAQAGDLPARLVAGEWRFARAALLDWLRG
ncbi:MAG: helix-turn-helix domain-containing protein [Actinomycetota bacterium]|nr:helix-turn-helix domain-containing protein [Actinomycetota bacterium]